MDSEAADGSILRIEGEEEFAAGTDGDVEICGPSGFACENREKLRSSVGFMW